EQPEINADLAGHQAPELHAAPQAVVLGQHDFAAFDLDGHEVFKRTQNVHGVLQRRLIHIEHLLQINSHVAFLACILTWRAYKPSRAGSSAMSSISATASANSSTAP